MAELISGIVKGGMTVLILGDNAELFSNRCFKKPKGAKRRQKNEDEDHGIFGQAGIKQVKFSIPS